MCPLLPGIRLCVIVIVMHAKQLLAEALRLPDQERAAIAGHLIESLDRQIDEDVEAAWSIEIGRRLRRLEAGVAETIPWAEARRRILAATGRGARA